MRQVAALLRSPHAPLISPVDPTTVWAWVGMAVPRVDAHTRQQIDRLVAAWPGIRLALGGVDSGVAGFRRSHELAVDAREVALVTRTQRGRAVIAESDQGVGFTALLIKDRGATLAWMRRVLGPFAGPGEANEAMRQTASAFFESEQNHTFTAQRLGVHRNTVRHRIDRFRKDRIEAGRFDPTEITLALRLYEALGG